VRPRALAGFGLALAVLAALSLYRETLGLPLYVLVLLTTVLFWITQATSWNLLSGFSGYFSFGQAAYVGVGAYATAVLHGRHGVPFGLTVLVAAGLCALLGLAVGALAFRLRSLRGEIFALLTLAVPFILAATARISRDIDGGQGIVVPVPDYPAQIGLVQDLLYLLQVPLAVGAVAVAYAVAHSRFGWALAAVRDAEDVGEGLGVATFRYKLMAIVLSAVLGGMGGSLYALQIGFVTVESVFNLTIAVFVIVMSVLGGRTTWLGPVLGAVVIVLLQERLTTSGLDDWRLIVLGAILVVLVVIAPDGLHARLRRRPVAAPVAGVAVLAGLALVRVGESLDWVLAGALATTVVAIWPARRTPTAPTADPEPESPDEDAASPEPAPPDLVEATATGPVHPPAPPADAGPPLVVCAGLSRYYGGVRALEGLDLTISAGELVGLVGPNGSGKTTLVGLLSGGLRPTHGRVHVAGHDIAALPAHRIAHVGVARTYQIPRPFASMTVRDNVAMALMFGRQPHPLRAARIEAMRHLEFVRLAAHADTYPSALNLHQRQLLEIARAIATGPRLLLLDEALAGLNPAEIDAAVALVRRIHASGISIMIVEHRLRVVNQLASRIIVLNRGTLLADGEPRAVLSDPAVTTAYLGRRAHA
jgi:branched-chain amino acid transport system permease protein